MKIVAFSGPSNSGKTTLIVKIANHLINNNKKVAIIKHDPKDKAIFDKEGKDSFKFSKTGADVAVLSPTRTTIFKKSSSSVEEMFEVFKGNDYLLVEGLKTIDLPRITIFRNSLDKSYFKYSDALAIDDSIKEALPKNIDILDLNNTLEIIAWIDKNAKNYSF